MALRLEVVPGNERVILLSRRLVGRGSTPRRRLHRGYRSHAPGRATLEGLNAELDVLARSLIANSDSGAFMAGYTIRADTLLASAAWVASWLPARRAARVDPLQALCEN